LQAIKVTTGGDAEREAVREAVRRQRRKLSRSLSQEQAGSSRSYLSPMPEQSEHGSSEGDASERRTFGSYGNKIVIPKSLSLSPRHSSGGTGTATGGGIFHHSDTGSEASADAAGGGRGGG
ncbi:unnamed protein product, partial [Scytosiphon promiscuus]